MTTLIVTSSAHGSTREIAERVAEVVRSSQAVETVVEDVAGAAAWLATADAVIVAAPVYTGSLAADARTFLDTRRAELTDKPLVILASGGAPALAPDVREKLESHGPREVAYFRGALVEERLGWLEKLKIKVSRNENYGDFRDWDAIEAWAKTLSGHGVR